MQNVAILLPTSFDKAYSRQEQADMMQDQEATTRRTEGGLLQPNRTLGVQACLVTKVRSSSQLPTRTSRNAPTPARPRAHAARPQPARTSPVPAGNGQLPNKKWASALESRRGAGGRQAGGPAYLTRHRAEAAPCACRAVGQTSASSGVRVMSVPLPSCLTRVVPRTSCQSSLSTEAAGCEG